MGNSLRGKLKRIMRFEQSFHEDILIMHPEKDDVTLLKLRIKYIGDDETRIYHALKKKLAEGYDASALMHIVSHHESEILFLNDEFLDMISEYKTEIRSQVEDYANLLRDTVKIKLKAYGFRLISFHIVECVTHLPCVVTAMHTLTVTKCLRYITTTPGTSSLVSKTPSYICLNAVELFVDALTEHPVYRVRDVKESERSSLDVDASELYKTSKDVFTKRIKVGVVNAESVMGNEAFGQRASTPKDIICIQRVNCDIVPMTPVCLCDMLESLCKQVQEGEYVLTDNVGTRFPSKLEHLASMYRRLQRSADERDQPRRRSRTLSLSMRVTPRTHAHYR